MILTVTLNPALDKFYIVERFVPGEVIRASDNYSSVGGKGINVAKVAKLTGEEVSATGFLGGYIGDFIKNYLKEKDISDYFIKVDGTTRLTVNIIDKSAGNQTGILDPGEAVTRQNINDLISQYERIVKNCDIAVISGSVPTGVDETVYPKLIEISKKSGKKVIFDSSGDLLKAGIKAKPYMIKPNADEIKQIIGSDVSTAKQIIEGAKQIQKSGINIVAVSLGKDGAIVVCDEGVFRGTPPEVKVVNTVGCGDSMVAAFAVGLSRKYTVEETFKLSLAVSAANAMTRETGYYEQGDLKELLPLVKVERLAD